MSIPRKRSRLFVDAEVQGLLVKQLVSHWLIAAAVLFLYLLIIQLLTGPHSRSLGEHAALMWDNYGAVAVAMLTVFPVFVYDSIKLSHRIAGPMVSFRQALGKLARGEVTTSLQFRRGDVWQQLSGDLNSVARRMDLLRDDSKPIGS